MKFSYATVKKVIVATAATAAVTVSLLIPSAAPANAMFDDVSTAYKSKCASCHGMDGKANTAKGKELKVRALNSPEVKAMSDQKILDVMLKGKGKMQGYEKSLGKEMCQKLVAYCRTLAK